MKFEEPRTEPMEIWLQYPEDMEKDGEFRRQEIKRLSHSDPQAEKVLRASGWVKFRSVEE